MLELIITTERRGPWWRATADGCAAYSQRSEARAVSALARVLEANYAGRSAVNEAVLEWWRARKAGEARHAERR